MSTSIRKTDHLWLRISHPNPHAGLRLFCFPYAGGAASIYRTWPQHLPADIEVCAVQLPGRENRIGERPFTNLIELVQALLPTLLPHLDKPFAFFGHSMGALIAYEVARQLQAHGRMPTHLLISGRRAPMLPEPEALLHTLASDMAFLTELQRRYNNIPAVLFEDAELRELFVPLLRADLTLVETYPCVVQLPLPCPLVALGGTHDPRVSLAELQAWQALTHARFTLRVFPGDHFYFNQQPLPLLQTIAEILIATQRPLF